jgi:chaperonin GroEL
MEKHQNRDRPRVPGGHPPLQAFLIKDANFGFNAQTEVYEDLVKAGVIDPTKVTRSALQHASSISALMLTTEAMICEIPEKKAAGGGHDHGGMGGMGGMDM